MERNSCKLRSPLAARYGWPGHASYGQVRPALAYGSLATGERFIHGFDLDITGMARGEKVDGCKRPVSLFAGSFEGTIDWTFDGNLVKSLSTH